MSFIYFYINLLDAGLATPNLGLPCFSNTQNAVNAIYWVEKKMKPTGLISQSEKETYIDY
jgi:hypothetical protein